MQLLVNEIQCFLMRESSSNVVQTGPTENMMVNLIKAEKNSLDKRPEGPDFNHTFVEQI